jgi:hypothetical protein
MTERVYVAIRFFPADIRTYTYHYDGPEMIAPGDRVVVATRRGQSTVEVMYITASPPDFETKAIEGIVSPPRPPGQAAAAA